MRLLRSLSAGLAGAAFLTIGAASAGVLDKGAVTSKEVVGPAAKGDPKPYHAVTTGTCTGGLCIVNFGKKPKLREIRMITCGILSDQDPALAAVIFGELADSDVRFYIPVGSVAPQGAGKVGIFSFDFAFEVPGATKLQVVLQTDGTASTGVCTATGTIR